jgi:beta-lactamase regulating signal transducer with metallopeptidase domain
MIGFQGLCLGVLVTRIGMALVHFLWQGAAIAILLAVILRMLRDRNPQARYLAAWGALLAMTVCLPMTAYLVPSPPVEVAAEKGAADRRPSEPPSDERIRMADAGLPQGALNANPPEVSASREVRSTERADRMNPASVRSAATATTGGCFLQPALPWIVGVWLLGATTLAVWHLTGLRYLRRLKRRGAQCAPAEIELLLVRLSKRFGIRRTVSALVSQIARTPAVLGWLRPVILLPASLLAEMPPEQLEMILAHELAHIRRLDYLWNLLQIAIETVLFYHPATWWVSRRIREERENCCDRQAATMGSPRAYAGALIRLAEIRHRLDSVAAPAAGIGADGGSLESRIRQVLGLPIEYRCAANAWLAGVLAVLILAAILVVNITWAADKPSQPSDEKSAATSKENGTSSLSMSAEAFAKLSDAGQRDLLVKAFQKHLERGRNLFYEIEQIYQGYDTEGWEPGMPTQRFLRYRRSVCRCWWLGNSYKRETYSYDEPGAKDFSNYSAHGENADENVGRNISIWDHEGRRLYQGQVVYPLRQRLEDHGGGFPSPDDALGGNGSQNEFFEYLARSKDKYEIKSPLPGDKVQLTVPWHDNNQVFVLDPRKEFLPIAYEAGWSSPPTGVSEGAWSKVKFEVQESRLIDNVWMPVKMLSKSLSSQKSLVITETTVVRIESGKVKPADVMLPFSKGMRIADTMDGITYTADAQGNAADPIEDSPGWKHEPPKGWSKGKVDPAYSMCTRMTAAQRKKLVDAREAKSRPIDEGMKVLGADPPASRQERIEAALNILRAYRVFEREADWTTAVRELIVIGEPAVPRLIEELDRTEGERGLRAMGFVLRGIGDARAIPALIRAIPRLIQPPSSDCGLTVKDNPELLEFMWRHDCDHFGKDKGDVNFNGLTLFSYERSVREVMTALEKVTKQSFGWRELDSASFKANSLIQQRRQRTLFLNHARKWADWWSHNWKDFVKDSSEAQLEQTAKSLDQFAESIARMPQPSPPTEIPCGPGVKIGDGTTYHQWAPYLNLDVGRAVGPPDALLQKSPKDRPSPELLDWAAKTGVDLLLIEFKRPGDERTYRGYQPVGMKVWRIDFQRFLNIEKELRESKKLKLPEPWKGPIMSIDLRDENIDVQKPACFLFITREGTCGTIKIRSGVFNEFIEGSPFMGPSVFEYQYIYDSGAGK